MTLMRLQRALARCNRRGRGRGGDCAGARARAKAAPEGSIAALTSLAP